MTAKRVCGTCMWLDGNVESEQGGYCLRMPPSIHDYCGGGDNYARFPYVHRMTCLCGEYRPHPRLKKKRNPLSKKQEGIALW
jgi:hypothetical protein